MKSHNDYFIWIIGITPLVFGLFFYFYSREPILASTWFHLEAYHLDYQSKWLNWFPSFVHQFSFVLLSWLAMGKEHKWLAIFLWLAVNLLFEIGQLFKGDYFSSLPSVLNQYFNNGSYSHEDMLAIVIATVIAYIVIDKYEKKDLKCI